MDIERTARRMLAAAERDEQSVERIDEDRDAEAVRAHVRRLARDRGLRIRTARMEGTVAVVLADAAVWHEDAATMRAKLRPVDRSAATGR